MINGKHLKLNVGSGPKRFAGWINVDSNPIHVNAEYDDILADVCSIPLPDRSVAAIKAIHVLEHLEEWDGKRAIAEWYRLLESNGRIEIELPDIVKVCHNVVTGVGGGLAGKEGRKAIFGDPGAKDPLLLHRWGYVESEVAQLLTDAGFRNVTSEIPMYHGCRVDRDMRLVATK